MEIFSIGVIEFLAQRVFPGWIRLLGEDVLDGGGAIKDGVAAAALV